MSSYFAYNGPMVTTGAYSPLATISGTKTMLQIIAGPNDPMLVWKWGLDFDGTGTTPVKCELIHTGTVAATVTSHVAAGIQQYGAVQAPAAALVNATAASSALYSGYNSTAEGTITTTRYASINSVLPGNGDRNEWSLGREFYVPAGGVLRVRVTATVTTLNCACYVMWDE